MILLYLIALLTFGNAYAQRLVYGILKISKTGYGQKIKSQKSIIRTMTDEMSSISMTDEWARYAKLQRKINKEKEILEALDKEESETISNLKVKCVLYLRCIIGLALAYILYSHRGQVVAQVDEKLLWPLASKLCWSDVPGGITVPVWVIISSTAGRSLAKLV